MNKDLIRLPNDKLTFASPGEELVDARSRGSKLRYLGKSPEGRNRFAWDGTIGSIHYRDNPHDEAEEWKEIDNVFEPALAPWDWQMLKAGYHVRVKEDFTAGQIIEFEKQGETVQFQPMALEWTNELDQIQPIAMPQGASPVVTNPEVDLLPAVGMPSHQGTIRWDDAYGAGIDFGWRCSSTRLIKILEIENLNKLPSPEQFILDGGNPVLRLNLIFDPSNGVDIYVDGELWDKKTKKQTFKAIEFRQDGEVLWGFMPLRYWGSGEAEENEGQSVATLEKRGNKLYISIRVPYEWLQSAVYPVFIDTNVDEQVGASADDRTCDDDDTWDPVDATSLPIRRGTESGSDRTHGGLRFTGLGMSQGVTIDVAYAPVYVYLFDDPYCDIYCEDVASPANFADNGLVVVHDRTRTSASAEWAEDNIGTNDWKNTPSLVLPVQEIATDYAIDTLVLLVIGKVGEAKSCYFRSWDYNDHSLAAKLHIEYTEVGPETKTKTYTLAVRLKKTQTKTYTLAGRLFKVQTKSYTVAAKLIKRLPKTYTLAARLLKLQTKTYTLTGKLVRPYTKEYSLTARIFKRQTKEYSLAARLFKSQTKDYTLAARLLKTQTKDYTLAARLVSVVTRTKTYTVAAKLIKLQIKTYTLGARLKKLQAQIYTLAARLFRLTTKTYTLSAKLVQIATKTYSLAARLLKTQRRTYSLAARLFRTEVETYTLGAYLISHEHWLLIQEVAALHERVTDLELALEPKAHFRI